VEVSRMSQSHIQDHVEMIAKHEQEFLANRSAAERLSDAVGSFIGSLAFVGVHLCIFAVWIVWNCWPGALHWDAKPFGLLQTCVAMESILAASFILMRQARLGRRSDERDHLMLQVLLLTEKEITAVLSMDRKIATEMGLGRDANTVEVRALSQETSIDDVAQTIRENLESS
jgi:uncharacterized membrane protein